MRPTLTIALTLGFAATAALAHVGVKDPQVMARFSVDGGNVFTNAEWRSWGKIGEYDQRAIWRRRGRMKSRGMICEFALTDPINFVLTGVRVNDE